jgi:hypothetical protein
MSISLRRCALAALAPLVALLLAACAGLGGPPTVRLSEGELDRLVQKRLPLERRVLEVFDVTLPAARLKLLPERNRLWVALDAQVRERLLGAQWKGQLALDAALRWEPQDQTVRLAQVKVLDFRIDAGTAPGRGPVERVGAAVAERMLEDFAIYRLPAERAAQLQRQGLTPGAVTVTSRGVEITFAPAVP